MKLNRLLYRVYDDFDDEHIIRNVDGTLNVSIIFPEDEWVYAFIMSFGNHVEVLEPEHIREIIKDKVKKILEYYDNKE